MDKALKVALTCQQEMDAYLESHSRQEIIDHIKAALHAATASNADVEQLFDVPWSPDYKRP